MRPKKEQESLSLTKAEEQIMRLLWKKEQAFVNELVADLPDPKPAYNTVSTVIRTLEKKGFVDHQCFGKSFQYFPLISEETYVSFSLNNLAENYFNSSYTGLFSFFAKKQKLSKEDIREMERMIEKLKRR